MPLIEHRAGTQDRTALAAEQQESTNDLAALASSIRARLQDIKKSCVTALRIALDVGKTLNQVKEQVPDKEWGKWLRDNCFLSVRSAQLYMQLADHRDEIEAEIARFDELSIRQARKLIAKPKTSPQEEEVEPVDSEPAVTTAAPSTLRDFWPVATEPEQDELTGIIVNTVSLTKLFALMSPERRAEIERRVLGQAKRKSKVIEGTLAA
jgi:hypothetical protein